jgi:AAA domain
MSGTPKAIGAWRDHAYSASALRKMEFPPIKYIVPGIIPEGLSLLAGRPKVGKSWLALETCHGITTGTKVLGKIDPLQGDVLYAALEDNQRRMKRRMYKLAWSPGAWSERFTMGAGLMMVAWKTLAIGLHRYQSRGLLFSTRSPVFALTASVPTPPMMATTAPW